MDYNILPLFKSHFSLGKSILTLESPEKKEIPSGKYINSIFDILKINKLDTLTLVDDNISGLLQASKISEENKVKLIFGIRIYITDDISIKDDNYKVRRAKYIIFAKNTEGYKSLIKIWSFAAKEGFYYNACIDFKTLKKMWNKNLIFAVPFYDSFLHLNLFNSHQHIPDFSFVEPTFFLEDNSLPFDSYLQEKVKEYCATNKFETLDSQSIFYKSKEDFIAYLTFRCIHSRGSSSKSTLEKPELKHMGSDEFNFDKWLINNNK